MDERFAWLYKLQQGTQRLMEDTPLKDIERNAQVWFDAAFEQAISRLKLIRRDEYEALSSHVEGMTSRIETLEERIKTLERSQANTSYSSSKKNPTTQDHTTSKRKPSTPKKRKTQTPQ